MLELLGQTLMLAVPLVLAAMGGYTSERSGVTNIGLEGMMLSAACAVGLSSAVLPPWAALCAGIVVAVLLSLVHWVVTQVYRVDQVISGMTINLLAAGGTNFMNGFFPTKPGLVFLSVNFYAVVALLAAPLVWWYSKYTRGGLRLQASGSDPDKARLAGINPILVRFGSLAATGVFCGLSGAMMITYAQSFTNDMTAGKGYIALAALVLGGWRPLPTLGACAVFAFFNALQLQFQGSKIGGLEVPPQAWSSLPYLVTIIALAGFLGRNRTPAGIGKI